MAMETEVRNPKEELEKNQRCTKWLLNRRQGHVIGAEMDSRSLLSADLLQNMQPKGSYSRSLWHGKEHHVVSAW